MNGQTEGLSLGKAALAAIWLLAAAVAPQFALKATAQPATLIRDVSLFDGTGGPKRAQADILIENGRIARVGPTGSFMAPAQAVVVNGSGKTAIPGIINLRALAGLVRSPTLDQEDFARSTILDHLRRYASYGVTTVATLGPAGKALQSIRRGVDSGTVQHAARVLTPLRALRAGIPRTEPYPRLQAAIETVRNPEKARGAVRRLARSGADFVEFWDASGAVPMKFSIDLPREIVRQARHRGLQVAVVTSSVDAATELVRAGARIVAGSVCDREVDGAFVSLMRSRNAVYAPALFAQSAGFVYGDRVDWLDDRYLRRSLPSGVAGILRGSVLVRQALDPDRALKRHRFDTAQGNLRELANSGVQIGFASGSGYPGSFEGYSEYREAVLMKRAGLSPSQILQAFSTVNARALGIDRHRGALLPGRVADIVLLNADPLVNIHNLRELHAVFIGGRLVRL